MEDVERKAAGVKSSMSALMININHTKIRILQLEPQINIKEKELFSAKVQLNEIPVDDQVLGASKEYQNLNNKAQHIEQQIKSMVAVLIPKDETMELKQSLQSELRSVICELSKSNRNVEIDLRIAELEDEAKRLGQVIAQARDIEYQVECFEKDRARSIEDSVSSMFSLVRFKLFEQNKTNDGEQDVCECMVQGVPYNGNLNTATRINAGIDIVNVFSKSYGVSVPLWIDNKESVNDLISVDSQAITLQVVLGSPLKVA